MVNVVEAKHYHQLVDTLPLKPRCLGAEKLLDRDPEMPELCKDLAGVLLLASMDPQQQLCKDHDVVMVEFISSVPAPFISYQVEPAPLEDLEHDTLPLHLL